MHRHERWGAESFCFAGFDSAHWAWVNNIVNSQNFDL